MEVLDREPDLARASNKMDATERNFARSLAFSSIRRMARIYIRWFPWKLGKQFVKYNYDLHVGWRSHKQITRTRAGDLMEVSMPDGISSTIFLTGAWEEDATRYVRSVLKEGDIFVDVGANIGYYSVLASRLVGPSGHAFSIEAHPTIHGKLRRNIELNGRTNVTTINAAASDHPGELPLFMGPDINPGHTTTVERLAKSEELRPSGSIRCDTLEALVGDDLFRARMIKIDVEGAEYSVLSPLFSKLDHFSLSTEWLVELTPSFLDGGQREIDAIYRAFQAAGYHALLISTLAPVSDRQSKVDVLMTRRQLLSRPKDDSTHHVCEAFMQLPDGGFQCTVCGSVTADIGDLP